MKKCAFTIMELLVAMSVIVLLSGVAVPALGNAVQNSKRSRDLHNLRQIGVALQAFQTDHDGRMPQDQGGGYFVLNSGGATQILSYTGSDLAVWHSNFDPRPVVSGDEAPVSYSINKLVLTPPGTSADAQEWTGNLATSEVPLPELLLASPSVEEDGGTMAWAPNTASRVNALSNQSPELFDDSSATPPPYYKRIPVLFADGHVEMVPFNNYQGTAPNQADWVKWDPMGASLAPLPLIAWDSGSSAAKNSGIVEAPSLGMSQNSVGGLMRAHVQSLQKSRFMAQPTRTSHTTTTLQSP